MPGFFLFAALAACGPADTDPAPEGKRARLVVSGNFDDPDIAEASGIASSRREQDLLWVHNDSGSKARIYAVDVQGGSRGRIKLDDADNDDWEDMAAFSQDGKSMLVVADIGDNDARRKKVRLYIVAEPDLGDEVFPELEPAAEIDFRYPDGARDAEAMAIDVENERALILTKRDLPPRLYAVPLAPQSGDTVTARLLGSVTSLPRPSRRDVEFAVKTKDWHWQPTAMDIAPDASALVILTYGAVYYFARSGSEDWLAALGRAPLAFPIGRIPNAEALAFSADGNALYLTVEGKRAPLLRIDLRDRAPQ